MVTFTPPNGSISYATSTTMGLISIEAADSIYFPSSQDIHVVYVRNVTLYPLNAALSGQVFAQLDPEHSIPAANAIVKLSNLDGYDIIDYDFRTVCDSLGRFSLVNIPAVPIPNPGGNVNFTILPWSDGLHNYSVTLGAIPPPGLISESEVQVNPVQMQIVSTAPAIVSNNFANGEFPIDQNLQMTFSKALDSSMVEVDLYDDSSFVPTTLSWDQDLISLTADPAFILRPNTEYTIHIYGRAQDYSEFDLQMNFMTEIGIEVLTTNMIGFDGQPEQQFDPNALITIQFSKVVEIDNPANFFQLTRTAPNYSIVWTQVSWSEDHKTASIDPGGYLLSAAHHNLSLGVYSVLPGDWLQANFTFTTANADTIPPAVPTGFETSSAATVNWNTNGPLSFSWNVAEGVNSYRIYAKDNANNPTIVALSNPLTPTFPFGTMTANVSLPAAFDWLPNDGIQTPFSNGIEVSFYLAASNADGMSDLTAPIILSDVVAPTLFGLQQQGTAYNTSPDSTLTFTIGMSWQSEYCDPVSTPFYDFIEAGGDPNFHFQHSAANWQWNNDTRSGFWTVTVLPLQNGRSDLFYMTGLKDNSGNVSVADTTWITLY